MIIDARRNVMRKIAALVAPTTELTHVEPLWVMHRIQNCWIPRTVAGNERWLGVGPVKDIPLKRARELRAENRRLVAEGIDPREHRRQLQAAAAVQAAKIVTFEQMGERFIVSHEAGCRNAKHRQQWRNTLETYVYPVIGELPVQAIDARASDRDPSADMGSQARNRLTGARPL